MPSCGGETQNFFLKTKAWLFWGLLWDFVRNHLAKKSVILLVPDLQSAWILLLYCVATRANYVLRVANFEHDIPLVVSPPSHMYWAVASLPFVHGGVGLRSAEVTARAAFWSSWADCMPMIHARHSAVSTLVIQQLPDGNGGFHVGGLAACEQQLRREGFEAPGCRDLALGLRPGARQEVERTVGVAPGWQHEATDAVLIHFLETSVRPRLTLAEQALLPSQR